MEASANGVASALSDRDGSFLCESFDEQFLPASADTHRQDIVNRFAYLAGDAVGHSGFWVLAQSKEKELALGSVWHERSGNKYSGIRGFFGYSPRFTDNTAPRTSLLKLSAHDWRWATD